MNDDAFDGHPGSRLNLVGVMGDASREQVWGYLQNYVPGASVDTYPELDELIDDILRQFAWHGEADADRAARGRQDRGIDADHLAIHVEQRATGIAAIDGGVGLDEIVIGALTDVTTTRRDDAGGDGATKTEGVTNGDHPVANTNLAVIGEIDVGEFAGFLDLEDREIGLVVDAEHRGSQDGEGSQTVQEEVGPEEDVD